MQLHFNPASLNFLKFILALVMLGVALEISLHDLKNILKYPKAVFVGLFAQFIFLPVMTFVLITIFDPSPSIALGMIIVAACPGGNMSNFFTLLAKGNIALSVCLTFMATVVALFMTPFNISFWGGMNAGTKDLITSVALSNNEVVQTVVIVLGIPLVLGLIIKHKSEVFAVKLQLFLKKFSMIFLFAFVFGALFVNYQNFMNYVGQIFFIVLIHNAIAMTSGYSLASLFKLDHPSKKAITIEVGIQNSGLALALCFEFFQGLGGIAIIAAWWGVWHVFSGGLMAYIWSRGPKVTSSITSQSKV